MFASLALVALLLFVTPDATAARADAGPALTIQQQLDLAESQRTSAPDKARALLDKLQRNPAALDPEQQHQLQYIQAYLLAIQGEFSKAISLLETLRQSPYVASRIKGHLLLANMHESLKDFTTAYESLYQALKDMGEVADQELHAAIYTVAAQLHISAGAYQQAMEFADSIGKASATPRSQCISHSQKLHALIRMQQSYPEALLKRAREACTGAAEPLLLHTIHVFTAEVDIQTAPALVKANMQEILPHLEAIGFPFTLASARYYLARADFQLGELHHAGELAQQVHQQAGQIGDRRLENQSLLLLAQLREANGQHQQALEKYKAHIQALNRFVDEFKQRRIAFHLAQADYIESQNRLTLLTTENQVLQLEAHTQQQKRLYATLGGGSVILGLSLALYGLNRKRSQLTTLATRDFLTQLYNRGHFTQLMNRWLGDRRGTHVHSLLLFDLDLFKKINDQYGHDVGDKVLCHVASLCLANIREQDILARIGGEEFALFLPCCDSRHALQWAEQCRQVIADSPLELDGQSIGITASFGIASATPPTDFETLFKLADEALYRSKDQGRNRCYLY
ncbi:MAG: GGDEF domain-containing protein [Haliea sp.]